MPRQAITSTDRTAGLPAPPKYDGCVHASPFMRPMRGQMLVSSRNIIVALGVSLFVVVAVAMAAALHHHVSGRSTPRSVAASDHARSALAGASSPTSALSLAGSTFEAPSIVGPPQVGAHLVAAPPDWPWRITRMAYRWSLCSTPATSCRHIIGATGPAITPSPAMAGGRLAVTVVARAGNRVLEAISAPTAPIAPADRRTFYISYLTGSDLRSGRSPRTAWKRAPGMRGFTGRYEPRAGDHFIFEGGVVWPNTVFPLAVMGSGTAVANDYYGSDSAWHIGSSFHQPTFDAQSSNITGTDANASGPQDMFFDLRGHDYITIAGIRLAHFTAHRWSGAYGSCGLIEMYGAHNVTVDDIAALDMSADATTASTSSCYAVLASTAPPYSGNSIVENSTFSGASNSYMLGLWCVGNAEHNHLANMIGMIFPCGHGTISGNSLNGCGTPFPAGSADIHADAIQSNAGNGSFYIFGNVIEGTGSAGSDECESMLIGNPGETDYVWDNVLYHLHGNAMGLTQSRSPGVAAYVWDNTIAGAENETGYCVRGGGASATWRTIVIMNNICISTVAAGRKGMDTVIGDPEQLVSSHLSIAHNWLLTPRQAAADHVTAHSLLTYEPPSVVSTVLRRGDNLTDDCHGALISLCVSIFATRPRHSPWDVGPFEW